MNIEDFCTYEQAVALNKLGFHKECEYKYYIPLSDNPIINYLLADPTEHLEAPTLAQAQKWLREKHIDINVCIDPLLRIRKDNRHYVCNVYKTYDDHRTCCYHGWYEIYEEALSAGITECIKILEKENKRN